MKNTAIALGILSLVALLPNASMAQASGKNIAVKMSDAKIKKANGSSHSKLTDILQSANFSTALSDGAYTIFAPTNTAFAKLPKERLSELLRPENRTMLKSIMARHVVSGNIGFSDLRRAINEGNGSATLKTLGGDSLTFRQSGSRIVVSDGRGNTSTVTAANTHQGNSTV
jgi:uncharacterized surface protein with fasciclin (FAS1) repeats